MGEFSHLVWVSHDEKVFSCFWWWLALFGWLLVALLYFALSRLVSSRFLFVFSSKKAQAPPLLIDVLLLINPHD